MEKILIVEDDIKLADTLMRYLARSSYQIIHRDNGTEALAFAMRNSSTLDLIIMDIRMPGDDGISVCRQLRERNVQTPILMLTSIGDVDVIVEALSLGADDYLTKPFALPEILARIKAILRRPAYFQSRQLRAGELEIDLDSRQAAFRGTDLPLRRKEFDLLHYLVKNRNQIMSREQILLNVWSDESSPYANTVDVHIRQIRKKLEGIDPQSKALIQTVYGFGYKLNANN